MTQRDIAPDAQTRGRVYPHEVDERPDAPRDEILHSATAENARTEPGSGWGTKVIGIAAVIAIILLLMWVF